jgi:hypothetical protein
MSGRIERIILAVRRCDVEPGSEEPMARVLIAGCGYVGRALGAELIGESHEVWGLARRPDSFPTGIRPIAADLTDAASLARIPAALDAVFYMAAPGGSDDERYRLWLCRWLDGDVHLHDDAAQFSTDSCKRSNPSACRRSERSNSRATRNSAGRRRQRP